MKRIFLAIVFGALLAGGLINTPVAHADEDGFVIEVQQRVGRPAINTSLMISHGYQLCHMMDSGSSAQAVANYWFTHTDWSIASQWEAEEWVIAASDQLCPWQGVYRKSGGEFSYAV